MSQIENNQLEEIFLEYEIFTAQIEKIFADMTEKYPQEIKCEKACGDCCHAVFDLSLVEAISINRAFHEKFDYGNTRSFIMDQANNVDRTLTKLKQQFFKDTQKGLSDEEIMQKASQVKVRCPLLGSDDTCLLYEARPITCRVYGIPTVINGKGHVCPKCNFEQGGQYPTLHLDKIQDRLALMSRKISKVLGSKYSELHNVYVPVSMALINKYDDAYLGIKTIQKAKKKNEVTSWLNIS